MVKPGMVLEPDHSGLTERLSPLVCKFLRGDLYQLVQDLTYDDPVFGRITAKRGFITDLATIKGLKNPFTFPVYLYLVTYGDVAAALHDWLYTYAMNDAGRSLSRKECDQIFKRVLIETGHSRFMSQTFYLGTRTFGGSRFLKE